MADFTRLAGGAYGLATDDIWRLVQFGTDVYATQITDALQSVNASWGATRGGRRLRRRRRIHRRHRRFPDARQYRHQRPGGALVRRDDPTFWTKGKRDSDNQNFP